MLELFHTSKFLQIIFGLKLNHYNYYFLIVGSDGHKSTYKTKWVIDTWTSKKIQIEPYTCFGEDLGKLPSKVSFNDLTQIEGQKELIKSILKYGIGIVTNASNFFKF